MNIIVCIKQVPNTADVRIDPNTNTIIREGVESIVNPFDMYAIEEAVRLKERYSGKVTVITMGPMQAQDALKEAIAMGADEAVLLSDRAFAGSDTWATSYTLATAIKKIGTYDIIICGKQASDGDTAQVGPGISVQLDLPQITFVKKIESIENNKIKAERLLDEGYEIVECSMPVLISVVKEINEPRLPSLKGKIRANKTEIPVWNAEKISADPDRIGLKGSATVVNKIFSPPRRTGGIIYSGDTKQAVDQLTAELKEKKIL